jgi:hypothetical protein
VHLRPGNSFLTLAAAASAYAAAELIATLTLGRFLEWGRAEALLFFAWRSWLLIAAAALAAPLRWPRRLAFYGLALLLAGIGESLFLLRIGALDPWPEMLRGFAAAALLLVPVDLLIQAGRRWRGKAGIAGAAVAAALLLLVPGVRIPYDSIAIGPGDREPPARRPRLLLMTSLPIVWGEYGPFDRRSRPSLAYRVLQEEFDVRPIDMLDDPSLAAGRLLLLAQPRWLSPAELTALDAWVRRGGRAVILADPALVWPSELPLGDIRRPLPASLLRPLLTHWQLELLPPHRAGAMQLLVGEAGRLIVLDAPGRFTGKGGACRPSLQSIYARCALGTGRAILLADADLLRDDLWAAPGEDGGARHRRLADNPLHLADLLEEAAGVPRERMRAPVAWATPHASAGPAIALALLPPILLLGLAILLAWLRRFRPQTFPQGDKERTG